MKRVLGVVPIACVSTLLLSCVAHAPAPISLDRTSTLPAASTPIIDIVEDNDTTFVATSARIDVYRLGTLLATAFPPQGSAWTSMAAIDALGMEGRWIVATDQGGEIWRVTDQGERVRVGDRFALRQAHSIAAEGSTIAITLNEAVAVADGNHVSQYPVTGKFAVGTDRLARATKHAVELWDLARGTRVTFAVAKASFVGFAGATLVVGVHEALFVETARGLKRIKVPGLRAIAIADNKAWVLGEKRLFVLDGQTLVPCTIDVRHLQGLFGAGDSLWVVRTRVLERYDEPLESDARLWNAQVAPVFRRACASCHLPGGTSGIDLSTLAAWRDHVSEIRKRVLVERSMPPDGTPLSDEDRSVLATWLTRQSSLKGSAQ